MMISILLTIFLITISLEETLLQERKICLVKEEQTNNTSSLSYNLKNTLSLCAVKYILRGFYLLNTIILTGNQKAAQTTLIQSQILKFEG